MKNVIIAFIALVVSMVILMGTLFIPRTVYSKEDMQIMQFGYPFPFITQDLSRLDPPTFPRQYRFGGPWEYPFEVSWKVFSLSYATILGIIFLILIEGYTENGMINKRGDKH